MKSYRASSDNKPSEIQPCEMQPCEIQPCEVQPCDTQNSSNKSSTRTSFNRNITGKHLPYPYYGELLLTKPARGSHGVTFEGEHGFNNEYQMRVISQLPNAGDIGIREGSSCAVVGASGRLLNSGLGNQIDKHDVIVRMGAIHYGKDSGTRTTHYLFYPQHIEATPKLNGSDGDIIWVLCPYMTKDWAWFSDHLKKGKQEKRLQTDTSKFRIMSADWMRFMWEMYFPRRKPTGRWAWPTQGMYSVLFLLYSGRCSSIDVYGMGYVAGSPEYFWNPSGTKGDVAFKRTASCHDVEREAHLRKSFEVFGYLRNH